MDKHNKEFGFLALSDRGQITIPKELRDLFGLKAGEGFIAKTVGNQVVLIPARVVPIEELTKE